MSRIYKSRALPSNKSTEVVNSASVFCIKILAPIKMRVQDILKKSVYFGVTCVFFRINSNPHDCHA